MCLSALLKSIYAGMALQARCADVRIAANISPVSSEHGGSRLAASSLQQRKKQSSASAFVSCGLKTTMDKPFSRYSRTRDGSCLSGA